MQTDHDLSLHCETEENDEVEYENWPEYGHIKEFKEGASYCEYTRLQRRMPAYTKY